MKVKTLLKTMDDTLVTITCDVCSSNYYMDIKSIKASEVLGLSRIDTVEGITINIEDILERRVEETYIIVKDNVGVLVIKTK